MEIISNELSFDHPASSVHAARGMMRELIRLVRELNHAGCERTLRISRNMIAAALAPSYTVQHWLNDPNVDRDTRLYFRAVGTKSPYLDEIFCHELINRESDLVCEFDDATGLGLTVAYLLDVPVVSFPAGECFRKDPISVQVTTVDGDDLVRATHEICNLFDSQQFNETRQAWLAQRVAREREVGSGQELLAKAEQRFSRLILCGEARNFIGGLSGREMYFGQILRHLDVLEASLAQWVSGPFEPTGIRSSSESESTMKNPRLKSTREFVCPDGVERCMPRHTKLIGANLRIHFLDIESSRSAYIGYIGRHLPVSTSTH